jgi:hypothetical protein
MTTVESQSRKACIPRGKIILDNWNVLPFQEPVVMIIPSRFWLARYRSRQNPARAFALGRIHCVRQR